MRVGASDWQSLGQLVRNSKSQIQTQDGMRGPPASWPPYASDLNLLPSDTNITLTIYTDNTFAECFFMDGRTVLMRSVVNTPKDMNKAAGVAVVAMRNIDGDVAEDKQERDREYASGLVLESAFVWKVNSIWVTPEQVLATPRPDITRGQRI